MKKALPLIATAALGLAACGKPVPVAQVEINPRQTQLPFSQVQTVHLTWTPSASIGDEKPTVFVHLLDSKQKVARTFDHPFPERWREGAPVGYDLKLYQSALAEPLAPGKYQVTLGLYGKDGKRWPLDGLGQPVGRDEYNAFEVQVPNSDPQPRFAFSPNWMEAEPGGDRQVLARRWMVDRGAIRLVDQRAPGAVWMVVQIPPANPPDYRMVLDPAATTPSVTIRGNCGCPETSITGPGLHEVELNLEAPAEGDFCHVLLVSSFVLEPLTPAGKKRSASLENLAWISGRKAPDQPAGAGGEAASPTSPQ
ncbi:MAG: hypothetical protein ACJ76N_17145 [Thermoanaerobaculia bacterium]